MRYPTRVVEEHTVDLRPLFRWWTNHSGVRPLRAWAHLTGRVVATNSLGWELEAKSDWASVENAHDGITRPKGSETRIVLKNPPAAEKAEFERLAAELAGLNRKRSELSSEQAKAKQHAQALAHSRGAARVRNFEVRQARAIESEAGRELKSVDAAIKDLKQKLTAYPSTQRFVLDCFALHTDEEFKGLPVYDHGAVLSK